MAREDGSGTGTGTSPVDITKVDSMVTEVVETGIPAGKRVILFFKSKGERFNVSVSGTKQDQENIARPYILAGAVPA